jgi:hypothetical protein
MTTPTLMRVLGALVTSSLAMVGNRTKETMMDSSGILLLSNPPSAIWWAAG